MEALVRRTLGQASAVFESGDLAGARSLAQLAAADSPTPSLRVEALLLLGRIDYDAGAVESMLEHLEQSLATAADDPDLQRNVSVSWVCATAQLDARRALELAPRAEQLLSDDSHVYHPDHLFDRFWAEAQLGRQPRRELLERGLELDANEDPSSPIPILWFSCTDDFDAARARHEVEDAWWRDRGDDRIRGDRMAHRALVELRAGNWELAEQFAERSCAMIVNLDLGKAHAVTFGSRSFVDAHRGRVERARSTLLGLLEGTEQTRERSWWVERLRSILGFVEFAAGDHEAADRALTQMRNWYDSMGVAEPLLDRSEPFHIESLLVLGELERARETLARLESAGGGFLVSGST
jgi:tetratricopeptide (TPR) repeat protein